VQQRTSPFVHQLRIGVEELVAVEALHIES
jgi:hypothetical protein